MKFAKTLQSEVVLEWSTKYIDYKGLKGKLRAVERAKRIRENRLSSTTFRRSIESNRNHANDNQDIEAPVRPQGLFSNSSQRAMSLTSIAESTSSWFNKVSNMLTNRRKPANPISPEHNPTPIVITSLETLMLQANRPEREFFTMLQKELEEVNEFYETKEEESIGSFEIIKRQYSQARWSRPSSSQVTGSLDEWQQKETKHKKAKKLFKKALFEIYRGTELLRKYRALNQIAIAKILKKYDKIANVNARKLYMRTIVNEKNFVKSKKLENLAREIEDFYSDNFEEGSRRRSMKKLRIPSKKNVKHYSSMWRTGLCLGMSLPFFIHSVYLAFKRNQEPFLSDLNKTTIDLDDYPYNRDRYYIMQLYAGMGIPIVFMLLIGVNMYVWTRARINYKFIFEFDPRDNIDYHQYLEIPSFMFLALSIFMYLTIENTFGIQQEDYPKVLMILILAFIFMPIKTFYYSARRWLIFTVARIFASPFTNVGFRDFFIADELTSLSYSFTTLQLLLCTCTHASNYCAKICVTSKSVYSPFLASIPAIIRSLQCLRRLHDTHKKIHMINFGKYMSTVLATYVLFFHRQGDSQSVKIIWVTSQLFNSIYTIIWDVKMDWRLFQPGSNLFLREQLEYGRTRFYYCGIVADVILRFSWVLVLIRDTSPVVFVVALGEVLRRWIWNFFRVENDHANNCVNTRAIGIDKIIGKLMGDPIIKKKDLGDFSTGSESELAKNGWEDFEIRSNNEQYEYSEDDEDEDDEDDDEFYKGGSIPRKYLINVDLSTNNSTGLYASRRLPLSISSISNIIEMPEGGTDDSSLV